MPNSHSHSHDDHGHAHHGHDHDPAHGFEAADSGPRDLAHDSLVSALRASFRILRLIMVVLVVLYAFSGVFRVQPSEQGLVVRFGQLRTNDEPGSRFNGRPIFEPGFHAALPDPLDEKILLSTKPQSLILTSFLFSSPAADDTSKPLADIMPAAGGITPGADGALFTGDRNLSHARFTINYHVAESDLYVRNVGERKETVIPILQRLAESAIVREAAMRTVEEVLGRGVEALAGDVRRRLQESLDALQSGVAIDTVSAETIEPYGVRDKFQDVVAAENDFRRLVTDAQAEALRSLNSAAGDNHEALRGLIAEYAAATTGTPDAQKVAALREKIDAELSQATGEVKQRLQRAAADATAINQRLKREYDEFTRYLAQYRISPALTLLTLWTDMRESVLKNPQVEVVYLPAGDDVELLFNSDPERRAEAEAARLMRLRGETPPGGDSGGPATFGRPTP